MRGGNERKIKGTDRAASRTELATEDEVTFYGVGVSKEERIWEEETYDGLRMVR